MLTYVDILNFSKTSIPFTYLGIPIGENQRKIRIWDTLIQNNKKETNALEGYTSNIYR